MSAKELSLCGKRPRWRVFAQFSKNNYLMCRTEDGIVRYAPLCIHTFRLIAPRKLLEAQRFNQQYHSFEEIPNIQDRLRWCRHHNGLTQQEVAELIGIPRLRYISYETRDADYYPKEIMDKLAALYQIPVFDLLDDYNRFLYKGQGKMIKEYRKSLRLRHETFARIMKIPTMSLHYWETDRKQISKKSWEKYFKDRIKV